MRFESNGFPGVAVKKFLLIVSAALLISSTAVAERGTRGSSLPADLLHSFPRAAQLATKSWRHLETPIRTHLRVHGMGKVLIDFDRVKRHQVNSSDPLTVLLRGHSKGPHRRLGRIVQRLTGSIVYLESGEQRLQFFLRRKGGRAPVRFYHIMSSTRRPGQAELRHAPSFALLNHPCGAALSGGLLSDDQSPDIGAAVSASSVSVTTIQTVADHLMAAEHGSSTNSQIATYINEVDEIYVRDLDLSLDITAQTEVDSSVAPTGITDSLTILENFNAYGLDNGYTGTADVHHLFTTRDMDESVIGLAYIGVICSREDLSYSLTQDFHPAFTPVVVAHELGHNFGAEHSGSGIMTASLGEPLPTGFAAVSIAQIGSHVASYGSLCLDAADSGPTAPAVTMTANLRKNGNLRIVVGLASLGDGCTVTLRASRQRASVSSGSTVLSFTPSTLSTELNVFMGRVSPSSNVFVEAEHSCTGMTSASSTIRRLSPRDNKQIPPQRFINRMSDRLAG